MFEQPEISIEKYCNLGKIFITGDFNSHTASSDDYFEFDKYIDVNVSVMDTCTIPKRTNKDRVLDHHGLRMIDLCQSTGLLIANGRLSDDMNIGKFTFCSQLGQSTVDYLLLNLTDFDTISYFDILAFNEHSDHAPITLNLPLKMKKAENNQENGTAGISRKIVWDKTKLDNFNLKLRNSI